MSQLGIKLKPKAGTLIAWNNLNKDGSTNTYTEHEALPPTSGKKYILTKWWRRLPLLWKQCIIKTNTIDYPHC